MSNGGVKAGMVIAARPVRFPVFHDENFMPGARTADFLETLAGMTADPEMLETLAASESAMVRKALFLNPNAPFRLKEKVYRGFGSVGRPELAERFLCSYDTGECRDDAVIRMLASDPDDGIRETVAADPATPAEILEGMAADPW